MATRAHKLVVCLATQLVACGDPVENPSAYESERYLCDVASSSEWDAAVAACGEAHESDESCAGMLSFTGRLEGQPVTIDSELTRTEIVDFVALDGAIYRDKVRVDGASSYFQYQLVLRELGGLIDGTAEGVVKQSGTPPLDPLEALQDDLARMSLRLSVGRESIDLNADRSEYTATVQNGPEQAGTFDASFGEDSVRGCFHGFVTIQKLEREEATADGAP